MHGPHPLGSVDDFICGGRAQTVRGLAYKEIVGRTSLGGGGGGGGQNQWSKTSPRSLCMRAHPPLAKPSIPQALDGAW